MILLSDAVVSHYDIQFKNTYGFNSATNYVFFVSQWIAFFLVIIASQFRPYRISYIVPIYITSLSFYWLYFTSEFDDKSYFNIYVFGFSILLLIVISLIALINTKEQKEIAEKKTKLELLENIFDLTMLRIKIKS